MLNYKSIQWSYKTRASNRSYNRGTCLQSAVNSYFEFKAPKKYLNPEYTNTLFLQNYINIVEKSTNCNIEMVLEKTNYIVKIKNMDGNSNNTYRAMVLTRALFYPTYWNIPKHLTSFYSLTGNLGLSIYLSGLETINPYYGICMTFKYGESNELYELLTEEKVDIKNLLKFTGKFNMFYATCNKTTTCIKRKKEVKELVDLIRICDYKNALTLYYKLIKNLEQ